MVRCMHISHDLHVLKVVLTGLMVDLEGAPLFQLSYASPHACMVPTPIFVAGHSEPSAGVVFSKPAAAEWISNKQIYIHI